MATTSRPVHVSARTLSGKETSIGRATLDAFSLRLGGRLILRDSEGYDESRRVWNGMVERRPAAIVRCSGVADVLESIRFAREHDLLIAVRGGGHNVAGFATCDGGLLIDLSPQRGIRVDPETRQHGCRPASSGASSIARLRRSASRCRAASCPPRCRRADAGRRSGMAAANVWDDL